MMNKELQESLDRQYRYAAGVVAGEMKVLIAGVLSPTLSGDEGYDAREGSVYLALDTIEHWGQGAHLSDEEREAARALAAGFMFSVLGDFLRTPFGDLWVPPTVELARKLLNKWGIETLARVVAEVSVEAGIGSKGEGNA